jgi:glycosyltransferase involved in cell wall biosynthesis
MPLVTVLIPTLNAEKFLESALISIKKQNFSDYEVVCVDAGSSDDTLQILERFNVKILQCLPGISGQLNYGLDYTDSRFVARFDADDLMMPNRLKNQTQFMDQSKVNVIGSNVLLKRGHLMRPKIMPKNHHDIKLYAMLRNPLTHPSVMFERDLLIRYDSKYDGIEDYELWLRLLKNTGFRFANLQNFTTVYRRHGGQVTADTLTSEITKKRKEILRNYLCDVKISLPISMLLEISNRSGSCTLLDKIAICKEFKNLGFSKMWQPLLFGIL